jgi:hypothetical protein
VRQLNGREQESLKSNFTLRYLNSELAGSDVIVTSSRSACAVTVLQKCGH